MMKDYFYNIFPRQLSLISFSRPSAIIQRMMEDERVIFFGGSDWSNVSNDLRRVPEPDRVLFIWCLFMVVLTDQALYTHFYEYYVDWRRITNFPKFGWAGFGPHNENPLKIVWAPERDGVIDADEMMALVPDFTKFFVDETASFFVQHFPSLNIRAYLESIMNDSGYRFDQGIVLRCFKNEFEAKLREISQ
jgi:hypothetical protein